MKIAFVATLSSAVAIMLAMSGLTIAQENPDGVNPTHFHCYPVKPAKQFQKAVAVRDQFGEAKVQVGSAMILCAPAQKDKTEPKDRTTHLVCYLEKSPKPANKKVVVNNQFGKEQVMLVTQPSMLCVPSLKKVL